VIEVLSVTPANFSYRKFHFDFSLPLTTSRFLYH
jgi:hypothetical protein